jgi:hypothetical protein
LGKSRTAEVKKDARVGEAEASRDAGIKVRLMFKKNELINNYSPKAK